MIQVLGSLGEQTIAEYLDVEGYLTAISTALGFDPSAMVKTADTRKQEAQARADLEAQAAGGQPPMQQ
jgi:phage terminase small subunit